MQEQKPYKKPGSNRPIATLKGNMSMHSLIRKILLLTFLLASSLAAVELNWEHNYDKALATAKKEHKDVYLFIGADNCKHCERFKKLTLSNKALMDTMKEKYVLLFMSRDQHKIPDRFEKFGVPFHYFLTSEGKIIAEVQGSRELAGWYDVLDEVDLIREN
jgi:thioredoxin-related protein